MIGRVDMLEAVEVIDHWKRQGLDLTNILHRPDVPRHVPIHHCLRQDHGLEKALDNELIIKCQDAIEKKVPVAFTASIRNINRTVGTMLSSTIARQYGMAGLPEGTVRIRFNGSAGQSFGAFLSRGVTFELEGDANDYVGKGISGGRIIVYPPRASSLVAEQNILVGNVVLYGGICGEAYFRGLAGERFAVRNSGVHAVVEGVGDHGCEYMTGGRVVVIGPTGRNFAAGMSGGIAYVWDKDALFAKERCNMGMVELFPVKDAPDVAELKAMISAHLKYTQSAVAQHILDNWDKVLPQFVKIYPCDYRRVIEENNAKAAGLAAAQAKA
jgi:glutamate synthase (ferredoxin)